jgi:hypothetical protein
MSVQVADQTKRVKGNDLSFYCQVKKESKDSGAKLLFFCSECRRYLLLRDREQIQEHVESHKESRVHERMALPQIALTKMQLGFPRLPRREISLSSVILGNRKGAWFYKRHPVATGKEVAAHIVSGLSAENKKEMNINGKGVSEHSNLSEKVCHDT